MAKKARRITWPKWVPVLDESDFRGVFLGTMMDQVFQDYRAADLAYRVAHIHYLHGTEQCLPRRRAAAWQKMLPDLGYTEDDGWCYV